jgi:uncharacterized protein YjiS (DUF1127 family)
MSDVMTTRFERARPDMARAGWGHPFDALSLMWRAYRSRQALLGLTPRELSDIGISRATAIAEASRMPWDITPLPRGRR